METFEDKKPKKASSRKATKKKEAKEPAPKKEFEFHNVSPEEGFSDGTLLLKFTIPGRPATKKTHQRIVRRGGFSRILPSIQYEKYEKECEPYCSAVWRDLGREPMDFGVSVKLSVFLDTWTVGDETGYAQSIGDIIEKHGIIANDMWIHWADEGIHMINPPDKEKPRVEITIRRFRHPKEEFRAEQEAVELRRAAKRAAQADKEK